jgi:SAM-dependent methyltransferase
MRKQCDTQGICRICGSKSFNEVGAVEYISGYDWAVYDCRGCGCRFTKHDESVYNLLHTGVVSYYAGYSDLADECRQMFGKGNTAGLRAKLCAASKYKFVLEEVERADRDAKLMEVGCSRGYLTSYFILAGHNVVGTDASPLAIEAARRAFGEHFFVRDSPVVSARVPYDLIYHVGTVGCVKDPIGFTKELLSMLRPGGRLIFNAPNLQSLYLKGQLWVDSAPPPDVVTLFPPGFWEREFSRIAHVDEEIEMSASESELVVGVEKLIGRKWRKPMPLTLGQNNGFSVATPDASQRAWLLSERVIRKIERMIGLSRLTPSQPTEFGLFVKLTLK